MKFFFGWKGNQVILTPGIRGQQPSDQICDIGWRVSFKTTSCVISVSRGTFRGPGASKFMTPEYRLTGFFLFFKSFNQILQKNRISGENNYVISDFFFFFEFIKLQLSFDISVFLAKLI